MRAILIDPVAKTVTEVDHKDDYRDIYRLIEAEPFTVLEVGPGDWLFLDDEGLYRPGQKFFRWKDYPQPLAGKGLLLGGDEEGDSVDTQRTIEWVQEHVGFLDDVFVAGFRNFSGTTKINGQDFAVIGNEAVFKNSKGEIIK